MTEAKVGLGNTLWGRDRRQVIAVFIAALLWLAAWTALPLLVNLEVPADNLEQLNWALNPAWGYTKHPPFPTLFLWCFEQIFPASVTLTYAMGALQVAVTLWLAWLLARATLVGVPGWFAPLMITCITYHTNRMHYYNHNTALMVAYAAALYSLWRAVAARGWGWWLVLGVSWGIGMLSKYQMAVLIACNVVFLWHIRSTGAARLLKGVALASAVTGILLIPHLAWLADHRFPSFGYASITLTAHLGVAARMQNLVNFVLHQVVRLAPLLLLLVLIARSPDESTAASKSAVVMDDRARSFWLIHAWGPLAIIVMLAALFGVAVENHWGMATLWALPMWILTTERGRRLASVPAATSLWAFAIVQGLMLGTYAVGI